MSEALRAGGAVLPCSPLPWVLRLRCVSKLEAALAGLCCYWHRSALFSLCRGYRGSCMRNALGFLPLQLHCSAQQRAWNYSWCIADGICWVVMLHHRIKWVCSCSVTVSLLSYTPAVGHTSWHQNFTFWASQNRGCSSWCKVQMVVSKRARYFPVTSPYLQLVPPGQVCLGETKKN